MGYLNATGKQCLEYVCIIPDITGPFQGYAYIESCLKSVPSSTQISFHETLQIYVIISKMETDLTLDIIRMSECHSVP